jgi:non-ribosomal peptide synthetase component F
VNLGNLQLDHFPLSQQEGQFDLNLDMMTVDGALYGAFKYRTDLFNPETLVNLERHFINLLQDIVQNPHEVVSKLALITQDERAHILELGKTAKAKTYPDQGCLVRRFEER